MSSNNSSNADPSRFKSSVNAICVWWLLSVGLSAIVYLLHSLIRPILEWGMQCNQQKRIDVNEDCTLHFDDVISIVKGIEHFLMFDRYGYRSMFREFTDFYQYLPMFIYHNFTGFKRNLGLQAYSYLLALTVF